MFQNTWDMNKGNLLRGIIRLGAAVSDVSGQQFQQRFFHSKSIKEVDKECGIVKLYEKKI